MLGSSPPGGFTLGGESAPSLVFESVAIGFEPGVPVFAVAEPRVPVVVSASPELVHA